ncbi:MAG: DNA polymerase-3 subunit delta [bacterium]|jgi:DNA polymerase-3 subunit delta
MEQAYFIYGTQDLELREKREKIISSLVSKKEQQDSVFYFDVQSFYRQDSEEIQNLFDEFQNTCETVSFFSTKIIIDLQNLEKIKVGKSSSDTIEKQIQSIRIEEVISDENLIWYDAGTISVKEEAVNWISGKQIIQEVRLLGKKEYYLKIDPKWKKRNITLRKAHTEVQISIQEFLRGKIKATLHFEENATQESDALNTIGEQFLKQLKSYLESPPDQVYFIMTANIRKPTELKGNLHAVLKKNAKEIKTSVTYDNFNPTSWVIQRAKDKQLTITPNVARLFVEVAGNDLAILDMEIGKLSLLYGSGDALNEESLLQSISHSKTFSVFRIANFLAQRNLKNSLESLNLVLNENHADAISIFGLISNQFRRLLHVSWMEDSNLSQKEIIQQLRMNPWFAKETIIQARNFELEELENIVIHLAQSDLKTKYAGKDAIIILRNLCFQICQGDFEKVAGLQHHWIP